jgi:YcxB-like protein
MTLKYDLTDAEYAEYVKNVYKNSLTLRGNGWKYIAFAVVIIGFNIYTSISRVGSTAKPSSYVQPLISWLIFIVLLGGAWFLITTLMSKINAINAQPKSKTWILALIGIGSFLAYLYFSSNSSTLNEDGSKSSITDSLLSWAFLACLIGAVWALIFSRLTSAKRLKPEDRETILGDREMTFDDDKLTAKNKTTESIFRWEAIKKWEQTAHLYLLFITDNSAFIVPKRIFENEEQQAEFEQLIKRKLPSLTSDKYLDA